MNSEKQKSGMDYGYVYRDTMEFIDIIVEEYGFYDEIINLIRSGDTEISIKKKKLTKTIEEGWVRAIEESLVALDNVIRKPSLDIEENELVMPIELSRNINARSIQHLAQHTDYISKIEGDTITPSKILNVFRDETNKTYENKFINTLIDRLYMFIAKRYEKLFGDGIYQNSTQMIVNTKIVTEKSEAKINFSIELFDKSENQNEETDETYEATQTVLKLAQENIHLEFEGDQTSGIDTDVKEEKKNNTAESKQVGRSEIKQPTLRERVEHIHRIVDGYINSDFVKSMDRKYVRPPIIRTNAITKNKDLRQCLILWEFIEGYDGIGCQIEIEETAENPNEQYINDLYSLLALQYVMFKYNINENLEDEILAENSTDEPLMPEIVTDFEPYDVEDYNVYDVEYKKLFSTDFSRRLTAEQIKVRTAIDVALESDKLIKQLRIIELLEEERLKQEAKLLEEELRLQRLEEERLRRLEEEKLRQLEEERLRQLEIVRRKKLARKVKKRIKKQALKLEEKIEEQKSKMDEDD